ncbi:MAG: hypothetical protein EOO81_05675 [Oxalobacteraceae bacterium]|nr:MAG: hypothetical protein EOO81_05675 [Oxalobacteraceae bacterium]
MKRFVICGALMSFGWCAPASADCLVRSFKDASGKDAGLTVTVPAEEASEYQHNGYVPIACEGVSSMTAQQRMCEIADIKNLAIQNRYEEVLGMSPVRLCKSARMVGTSKGSSETDSSISDDGGEQ